jgi:hypothetical protein
MRAKEAAAKKVLQQAEEPKQLIGAATALVSGATGLYGGSALVQRIIPFLSTYIPAGLAAKGLSNLDPRIEKYFKGIFGSGYTVDEGLDFLREQFTPGKKNTGQKFQSQAQNIATRGTPQFQGTHGQTPGSLREMIGSGQAMKAGQYQPQPQQPQSQASPSAPGPGQQALMQLLQQINQKLGQ